MKLNILSLCLLTMVLSCKSKTTISNSKETEKMPKSEGGSRPNLLIIVTDEHSFRTLGAYKKNLIKKGLNTQANPWGNISNYSTPNLDRIANEGAIFTSMYASSPSCTPSRSSMFTGNYPHTNGTPKNGLGLDEDTQTIAKVLNKEGYKTGYAGKWHLEKENPSPSWSPESSFHGFMDNRYMFNGGHWKQINQLGFEADGITPKMEVIKGSRGSSTADENSYTTDWLTNRTLEFIEENKKESFAYVLSFPDPHTPDVVRAPYQEMFSSKEVKLPETFTTTGMRDDSYPFWIRAKQRLPKDVDHEKLRRNYAAYHGSVKLIDDNIGRILKKLDAENILDNTIVVFSADHGDMLGEFGHENKGVPYEGSAKIPFLMRYPKNITAGTVIDKAANTTDWMDTFLNMMNVSATNFQPKTTEGRNLVALFDEKKSEDFEDITFVRFQTWASAMTDRYKLVFDTSATKPWLIDLKLNPDESHNYFDSNDHQKIKKELARKLLDYGNKTNDDIVLHKKIKGPIEKAIKG